MLYLALDKTLKDALLLFLIRASWLFLNVTRGTFFKLGKIIRGIFTD